MDTHSSSINGINSSLLQKLFTAAVLAIAFFISAGMVVYLSLRSKEVKVPNLIGKAQADAEKLLVTEGLRLKVRPTGTGEKTEASLIGDQTPSAGSTVKVGQVVTVTFGTDAGDKKEEVANANAKPTPKPTAKPSASPTAKPKPKPSGSPSPSPADASKGKDANKGDSKNTNETAKGKPSPSPTAKGKPSPSPTPKGKPSPSPTVKASPKPSPKKPGTN